MNNKAFYLGLLTVFSLLAFMGCDHPDPDTATYMFSKAEIMSVWTPGSGLKIIDVDNGDIPDVYLVMKTDATGATVGATVKGMHRCPPTCLRAGERAPLLDPASMGLTPATPADFPADRLRVSAGIWIPPNTMDSLMKDPCVNYITVSSEPGTSEISVAAVNRTANPGTRRAVSYP